MPIHKIALKVGKKKLLLTTGKNREGMFYAARTFAFKLGQSVSMLLFTALSTLGSGVEGYRIVAVTATVFCALGGVLFLFYNERKIMIKTGGNGQ